MNFAVHTRERVELRHTRSAESERHTLIRRAFLTVILSVAGLLRIVCVLSSQIGAAALTDVGASGILVEADRAEDSFEILESRLLLFIPGLFGVKAVERKTFLMPVLVEAVSELVVAIPVVRGAAFGADDDIVRTLKPLVAYGAVVLRKLHINLRTYSH
nr:hypothetical protein [uncultured Ruminococcus sp.]